MDRTEEYYSQYFDIKDTIEKERKAKYQKDVYKLEADLEEAWGSKDIDKIISINEIINEYRDSMLKGYYTENIFLNNHGKNITRQGFFLIIKSIAT